MLRAALLGLLLAAGPSPSIPGVPNPPDGVFEEAITKVATERATQEMKAALEKLDKDGSIPEAQKREIKGKLVHLKVAVFTTPKSLDEIVAFYEKEIQPAQFNFGERDILGDAHDLAAASGFKMDPEVEKAWMGKRGRTARWGREDRDLEIDVEDTLIDPRDGKITKKTVVLVTYLGS
jgi:hypothetical protein